MVVKESKECLNNHRAIDCEIEKINKQNHSLGYKVVLIAQVLGNEHKRWHNDISSKCHLFVDMVLRKAQIRLPWARDEHLDLYFMKLALLRHPREWRIVYYRTLGENSETFHARFVPQNGDIAIWDNRQVTLVGILEATFDRRGNILYLLPGENGREAGFEYRSLDWLVLSDTYGPPNLIVRKIEQYSKNSKNSTTILNNQFCSINAIKSLN